MAEVFNRHKDVQYSSRIASQIARQQQIHRLRPVINQLAARLPEAERNSPAARVLAGYGCRTTMHVVRLLAPQLDRETHTKDIDFSPGGIKQRWDAGYAHTSSVLARALGRRVRSALGRRLSRTYGVDAPSGGMKPGGRKGTHTISPGHPDRLVSIAWPFRNCLCVENQDQALLSFCLQR